MKVSIIIPVYNVSIYIERCLLSVYNQTYQDIEIIIVDDCGTDDSILIAREISSQYQSIPTIFLKHEHNRGLSAARNTGINSSTGDYIYFLDSDDSILENCIELFIVAICEFQFDFVLANHTTVGSGHGTKLLLDECEIFDNQIIQQTYYRYEWNMNAWNKLIHRKFLVQNNLYFEEGLIHEDDLWSFYLANFAHSMKVIKVNTYNHFIRPNSIMTLLNREITFLNRSKIIKLMTDYVQSLPSNLDDSVYSYLEVRKRSLFQLIYFSGASRIELSAVIDFIKQYPPLKFSKLSIVDKIFVKAGLFPKSIAYVFYVILIIFLTCYNKLRALVKFL